MIIHKILDIRKYLSQGDTELAKNEILDLALDSNKVDIYKMAIDWYHAFQKSSEHNAENIKKQTNELLEEYEKYFSNHSSTTGEPILTCNKISKTYTGGNFRMQGVSFKANVGEVIGLVGENGNGKTTLLRILAQDLSNDSGEIEYHLEHANNGYLLKSQLVYVPQRIPRWYGTLLDNLQFTLTNYGIYNEENILRTELMMARMDLLRFKDLKWSEISSGYKTRFELAKSLLRKPKVLLLDEPLANLDIISQQTVLQDLKKMAQSITAPFSIILSSQQLYEVEKVSDQIIFIRNGQAQYQNQKTRAEEKVELLFEIETKASREDILEVFNGNTIPDISFNGGVFILKFDKEVKQQEVLKALSGLSQDVTYFRNISHSSRRFFINS